MTEAEARALIRRFSKPLPVGAPAVGFCSEEAAVKAIMSLQDDVAGLVSALEPFARIADGAPADATAEDWAAVQFVHLWGARSALSSFREQKA